MSISFPKGMRMTPPDPPTLCFICGEPVGKKGENGYRDLHDDCDPDAEHWEGCVCAECEGDME